MNKTKAQKSHAAVPLRRDPFPDRPGERWTGCRGAAATAPGAPTPPDWRGWRESSGGAACRTPQRTGDRRCRSRSRPSTPPATHAQSAGCTATDPHPHTHIFLLQIFYLYSIGVIYGVNAPFSIPKL